MKSPLQIALQIVQPKPKKQESIEGWFTAAEAHFMVECINKTKRLPGVIVEIGSFLGRSSVVIARAAKENQDDVYCIDIWDNSVYLALPEERRQHYRKQVVIPQNTFKQFIANMKAAGVYDVITPIRGKSECVAKTWDEPIKLLFIDACHEYEYVIKDCLLWKDHIVKDGFLLFHDYDPAWPSIVKAVDECIDKKEFSNAGQQGSLKGFTRKND